MFETTTSGYSGTFGIGTGTTTGTITLDHSGAVGMGFLNPSQMITVPDSHLISNSNNMRTQQVKVAVFTITRDVDTNEINSTKFVKELWVEQKNGASIDLIVAKQLDADFDPETTVIKELFTISF